MKDWYAAVSCRTAHLSYRLGRLWNFKETCDGGSSIVIKDERDVSITTAITLNVLAVYPM